MGADTVNDDQYYGAHTDEPAAQETQDLDPSQVALRVSLLSDREVVWLTLGGHSISEAVSSWYCPHILAEIRRAT